MALPQTRRRFLNTLSLAGAAGVFGISRTAQAEEPPETRSIRFAKNASICIFHANLSARTAQGRGIYRDRLCRGIGHPDIGAARQRDRRFCGQLCAGHDPGDRYRFADHDPRRRACGLLRIVRPGGHS